MSRKNSTIFICQKCAFQSSKWMGKCPECQEWNTMQEEASINLQENRRSNTAHSSLKGEPHRTPQRINEVNLMVGSRIKTGNHEFDRVVGGGLVEGAIVLIGGEPGIGKSTLLMDIAGKLSLLSNEDKVLYVSGEESTMQVAQRSQRLNVNSENFYVLHETSWENILHQMKVLKPRFLVLDSIQTTVSGEIVSAPGTLSQIREVTYELVQFAKSHGITCFIIGHVTKEGAIAGPKILEHMVDTVVYFEGDQINLYRLLRVVKNRFGNSNEVGIFEMRDTGLIEVKNPSQYFLDSPLKGSYGRSLTNIIEGSRTLFVEIQALVVDNKFGNGRRTTQGIDQNRLAMLVAVIEKYFSIPLAFSDIYVNVVGGIKLNSRESDLCILASILSSLRSQEMDHSTIFLGEVGLNSEVRSVPKMEMRLKEMEQLNYRTLITSKRIAQEYSGKYKINIIGIDRANQLEEIIFC